MWSPDRVITEQEKRIAQRKEDFRPGDLIVGEFLGDADLLVLRCDTTAPDFGNVAIALPLDSREEWYILPELQLRPEQIFRKAGLST